ncbi:MAG: hypothetical protein ACYDGR_16090 [Candidatus Dormibacteria bacterium]
MVGVLAHVPIGLYNLPVPLGTVLVAAVLVVGASFGLIYVRAPTVRDESADAGAEVALPLTWLLQALGFIYLGFIILVGWFGRQELAAVNGASLLFWVYTIPFLPLAHCFLGGMYEVANPFALVARLLSGGRRLAGADALLRRLGYWPSVVMMFLLIFAESISEIVQKPVVLGIGAALYATAQVIMGVLLGEGWYRGGDVFHAITSLASTIAPAALQRDSRGVVRIVSGFNPARFLPGGRGREALITLWLAGVLADGVRATPIWRTLILPPTQPFFETLGRFHGFDMGDALEITLEITVTWVAFAVFFWVFVALAAALARSASRGPGRGLSNSTIAATVSPSLIPIALAYLFAHNLTQILAVGPLIITARNAPVTQLGSLVADQIRHISPGTVWWVQVTAIVIGHVVAVVMAHARLTRALPPESAEVSAPTRRGRGPLAAPSAPVAAASRLQDGAFLADLGWLSAMVIYTATSLWILAQPITASGH